jgi:hypothetical protein
VGVPGLYRNDAQADINVPVGRGNFHTLPPYHGVVLDRSLQGCTQWNQQSFTGHLEHIQARFAGCGSEAMSGVATEMYDLHIASDQHARRYIARYQDMFGISLHIRSDIGGGVCCPVLVLFLILGCGKLRHDQVVAVRPRLFPEDLVSAIFGREHVTLRAQ